MFTERLNSVLALLTQVDRQKVVVAMSGGVDSSVVAALFKEAGHEVVGVTFQLKTQCKFQKDLDDAAMAAGKIGIEHIVVDHKDNFKKTIIDEFVDSYMRGETPSPCVWCNKSVKLNILSNVMKEVGATKMATGHYVRNIKNGDKYAIHKPVDLSRDQSYFLFSIPRDSLQYLLFPLGYFESKLQVREVAEKHYGLHLAQKGDSQDICFVEAGGGGYRRFLKAVRPTVFVEGNVVFKDGSILGKHDGTVNYTIGQRRGISISHQKPLYVININSEKNEVIVGYKEDLETVSFLIDSVNILDPDVEWPIECIVKIRSAHSGINARVERDAHSDEFRVVLYQPYSGISPGQACVMYIGDRVIGGGLISKKRRDYPKIDGIDEMNIAVNS